MPKALKPVVDEDELIDEAISNDDDSDLLPSTAPSFSKTSESDDEENHTTSALAVQDESAIVAASTSRMAFDDNPTFGQDEIDIPRLRLLQGLSQEVQDGVARPGHWILPGHKSTDSITVIPLGMMRNREYRNSERIIQCSSPDAIHGVGDPGVLCNGCEHNQWKPKNDGSGKNNPPACSMIYAYICVALGVDNEGTPEEAPFSDICVIRFQKTQIGTAKWFNQMAMTRQGFGKFGVTLESSVQQGNNGKFYVPKPSIAMVSPTQLKAARNQLTGA